MQNGNLFKKQINSEIKNFFNSLTTENGDWIVKGFIDIYKNIYTISVDTKVVSKIIELMLFPVLLEFSKKYEYEIVLSEHQNHYPDITFISKNGAKIAVDLKSTYRKSAKSVNGFTLGAFTGYFRNRKSNKNITFPYSEYDSHIILGIIYSRQQKTIDEQKKYSIDDLKDIISVVQDFEFIIQEKWKLATDRPGSGNTKNIGSITNIANLTNGKGTFCDFGKKVFDDYWMNYMTKDMALACESAIPYRNIKEYLEWKNR